MNPSEDKVDLSSVNKTKKQFKLPKIKNPFKSKSAGPGRDEFGQFVSGTGGLLSSKKLKLSRILPLALVVAMVGGFLVFRSFAGTHNACLTENNAYTYTEECLTASDEANVVRLYYGIFNRAPDTSGLKYWVGKLTATNPSKKMSLSQIAKGFMDSSEFKNKYGTLSNEAFVKAMYPQIFNRPADASGVTYWTARLASKKITREGMIVQFTESSEMRNSSLMLVADALKIPVERFAQKVADVSSNNVTCYTTKTVYKGMNLCTGPDNYRTVGAKVSLSNLNLADGEYFISYKYRYTYRGTESINATVSTFPLITNDAAIQQGVVRNRSAMSDQQNGVVIIRPTKGDQVALLQTGSGPETPEYRHDIDISSIKIWKPTQIEPQLLAEDYPDQTNVKKVRTYSSWNCGDSGLTVGAKNVTCEGYWYQLIANDATRKPDWVHTSQRSIKGKVSITIKSNKNEVGLLSPSADFKYPAKLSVVLKNAKTNQTISNYRVFYLTAQFTDNKKMVLTRDPTTNPVIIPADHNGGGPIFVEADLPVATQVKLEVSVLEHPSYRFDSTSIRNTWPSQVFKEDGYTDVEQ